MTSTPNPAKRRGVLCWRRELGLFAAAWAIYDVARWVAVGKIGPATEHAHWVLDRRLRDTVLATWLLAVPISALFPVAPPRLAGIGMADTVSDQAGVALTGHSTIFYNPLAAVPSLHCGFGFAIGIALAAAARRPWTKALALTLGPIVSLAVVATGNHYVFDIVAGLLVSGLGYVVGPLAARWMASTTAAVDGRARSLALVET